MANLNKTMPIEEIISRVTSIAHKYNAKRLDLFGSFARGTQTERNIINYYEV